MAAPLIGITTNRNQNDSGFPQHSVNEAYINSLARAGAAPVMIPLGLDKTHLDHLLARLDGIVFSGGGDIHPKKYGSEMHPKVKYGDNDRDQVELHLVEKTIDLKKPFLGICRGLQVLNVGLGGTLFEDILDQRPGSLQHQHYPDWPRDYLAHAITVEPDSQLSRILANSQIEVNSLHHQGIDQLAPDLHTSAYAPDGLIEAVEMRTHPFGVAVQWHPEHLQEYPPMKALFRAFVKACM